MKSFTHGMVTAALAASLLLSGCSAKKEPETGFTPRMDKDAKIQLDMIGYFGNFEALDQVMSDFNRFYPNITYTYQQVGGSNEVAYLQANPNVDVIMTSSELLTPKDSALAKYCVDLSEADVDFSAIDPQMLSASCIDGKQLAVPMGQNIYGMIVNTSLLEKEGLALPQNREEFLDVLSALKEKGYNPVQGPTAKVYAELVANQIFSGLCDGQPLNKALQDGDRAAAEAAVMPALELVDEILVGGYTDPAVNDSYPKDNYDQAILRFLEGDVPFWVCNTEKVGGMKKRESKSEAFQKEPFSYTFIYPPTGENGAYVYREPWCGFAVNKDGSHLDYAMEFIRFLSTEEEINKMANIKGVPSVAKNSSIAENYKQVLDAEFIKDGSVNLGEVTPDIVEAWYSCMTGYAAGEYASAKDAVTEFLDVCSRDMGQE